MSLFGPKKEVGSTQETVQFSQIRDGIIILKDGNLRQVLMCTSINFSLKSEQEQNAIIFAYQNFLNSLNFPLQILMQSKQLDLSNYLGKLEEKLAAQTNELLRMQTADYIDFIKRLITLANIMDKRFFVVVPFMVPPKISGVQLPGKSKQPTAVTISAEEFEKYKKELEQRVQVVSSGLGSIGIRAALLNTQQLIELMYSVYNPEEASKEKIVEAEHLEGDIVESAVMQEKEENASAK